MSDAVTRSPTIATAPDDKPVIRMERLINAKRDAVFSCWEDPEALKHWWGPNGFTITMLERAFKVGGVYRFTMHAPDGTDFPNRVTYREITRPSRLVYTHDSGVDNDPIGFEVVVTFAEEGAATRIVIESTFRSMERRAAVMGFGAVELGQQTWDKLAEWAEGKV